MAKKRKNNQKRYKKLLIRKIVFCTILVILVLCFSYIIFETKLLTPRIDSVTTNYISFNNRNTTDMLRIDNIKKMSKEQGKGIANKNMISFVIPKEEKHNYTIVIVPMDNNIEKKYIHYALTINQKTSFGVLSDGDETSIYYGNSQSNIKVKIKMWVSKDYPNKVKDNSFEIKVKPR